MAGILYICGSKQNKDTMYSSLLYQAYGVKEYAYSSTEYKDNAIYLNLHHREGKRCKCPECHSYEVIRYGKTKRNIRNLPFGSKSCFLRLDIQRYHCKECEHSWQADIPFTHGSVSYTYRFSRYVLDLLRIGGTISDVAEHLHVGWDLVKDIHKHYLKMRYSCPDLRDVRHIGIDEFATRKGHVYKTIVVDLDTGRIIHVGNGKGSDALKAFWQRVRRNGVRIEVVTSDLSAAYIMSVMENAPGAIHVFDKFHIVKLVNEAVDSVRRSIWNMEKDVDKRKIIKGSRWLLLGKGKDIHDGAYRTRLENILATNKDLFTAYYLKEDVSQIWMQPSKTEAGKQLEYWCQRAHESKLRPFVKVANTLLGKRTGILAWYDCKVTNAMVEGINNKIKVLKRKAYGYRDDEYFDLLLLGMRDETIRKIVN